MEQAERDELLAWTRSIVGTEVELERAVVRREGWIVHAGDDRWFLRLGRANDPANPPDGVRAEGRLVAALGAAGMQVPEVVGTHDRGAVLYGWMPGTAEVEQQPPEDQVRHLATYMEQLAALHALDIDELDLDWMHRPMDARQCALDHAEAVHDQMASLALEPLSTFGIHWLRWHAPDHVERLSVLHGDAGVGNFLVADGSFQGIIDWEWGHIGDPMEDLGSAAMHAGFHPVGDFTDAIGAYERASGGAVDIGKVRYYAAHLYIRSVIALAAVATHLDPHNPVALNLAYKLVNDRLACEAIADALSITLQPPELPATDDDLPTTLYDVVTENLTDDVVPVVDAGFARDRAENAVRLVAFLGRRERYGPTIDAIEREELATLLGSRVDDVTSGLRQLDAQIPRWGRDREADVLRYLYRRAARAEWLASPIADMFPNRVIAALGPR